MMFTMAYLHAYLLLAILIALTFAIVLQIANGAKTFMVVCKLRRQHAIKVNLCILRWHIWRVQQYWIAENMLSRPLPFARTRKFYLRKSCSPQYWYTYHGQSDIADAARKPLTFKPALEAIVEERRFVRVRRPSNNTYGPFLEYAYHSTTSTSKLPPVDLNVRENVGGDFERIEQDPIPLAPKKPVRFRPSLEMIVEERRFVRVRRPRNGRYGPFLEYAYHSITSSNKAPVDLDVLDHVVDDFGFITELDEPMLADISLEQDGNTEVAARKRVIDITTSKKDSRIPRRSARIAELNTKTGIVLGSFFTLKGIRRSARLASL